MFVFMFVGSILQSQSTKVLFVFDFVHMYFILCAHTHDIRWEIKIERLAEIYFESNN